MFFKRRRSSASISCIAAVAVAYSLSTACVTFAQAPAAGGAPGAAPMQTTGPIDVQADEQDFAGDVVTAHGHVKVTYKESIIVGPEVQLFKDPTGQPQMAIFTGHPHLIQKGNKIDADKLTFQMAINKIVADGHAHSEVSGDGDDAPEAPAAATPAVPAAKEPAPVAAAPAPKKSDAGGWQQDDEASEAPAAAPVVAAAPAAAAPAKASEKIFVDSEHQEYESETGHFIAIGHCKVKHGDIKVDSNALNLVYGADGKPETALFSGTVNATQNGNNTKADHMTYSLTTQRLQASGNVRSKVIQQRPATSEPKKGAQANLKKKDDADDKVTIKKPDGTVRVMTRAEADKYGIKDEKSKKSQKTFELTTDSEEPIYIVSDSQDYTKENGRMTALGNVHVYYNDNKGLGHKVLMIRNEEGKAEKMIFTGRSQVIQPGKRWLGDKITFLIPTEKVVAEGNTRAIILNTNAVVAPPSNMSGADENAEADSTANSKVDAQIAPESSSAMPAEGGDNKQIGTTTVDNPQ